MKKIYRLSVLGVALSCALPVWAASTDIVVDPFAATVVTDAAGPVPAEASSTTSGAQNSAERAAVPTAKNAAPAAAASTSSARFGGLNTELPWLRAVIAFLFVSSLIFVIASIARRMLHGDKRRGGKRTSFLQLRQVLPLGMKRSIYVFDVEGTRLFVGMTGTTMQTLYTLPTTGISNDTAATARVTSTDTASFAMHEANALAALAPNLTMAPPPPNDAVAELRTALLAANDEKPATASPSALGEQIRAIVRNLRPFNLRTPADGRWTK